MGASRSGAACLASLLLAAASLGFEHGDRALMKQDTQVALDGGGRQNLAAGYTVDVLSVKDNRVQVHFGDGAAWTDSENLLTDLQAYAYFSQMVDAHPSQASAYRGRGAAVLLRNYDELALADFDRAILLEPDHAESFILRGSVWLLKHSAAKALADAERAIRLGNRSSRCFELQIRAWLLAGDHDRALAAADRAHQFNSQSATIYVFRGAALEAAGKLDEALADYTTAVRLDPYSSTACGQRAQSLGAKGQYAKAIKECTRLLQLVPKDAVIYRTRGQARCCNREFAQAIADFDEALRLDPSLDNARTGRAYCLDAAGDADAAIEVYDSILQRTGSRAAYAGRAQCWIDKREYDKAVVDVDRAIRHGGFADANLYLLRANARLGKHEYRLALLNCDKAHELQPSAACYVARASADIGLGEYEAAVADCDKAQKLDPRFADACIARACARWSQGQLDIALTDCDDALAIDSHNADAYMVRGGVNADLGRYPKAFADLHDALRLDPNHNRALARLAWLLSTCPDPQFRDGPQAVGHAMLACESTHSKDSESLSSLAAAYAEVGKFEEAVQWQEKANALNTNERRQPWNSQLLACYKRNEPYRDPPKR
ncbi:MAG TPA: tetratricopeptide repeat protein [Pirellulales bacterium]